MFYILHSVLFTSRCITTVRVFSSFLTKPYVVFFMADLGSQLGVAVIGAGAMSRERMRLFKLLKRPITAIYSHHSDKAMELVKEFELEGQTKVFDSISSFWEYEKSSYVYIATPDDTHCHYILEALRNHRHVMVENMLARSILELAEIQDAIHQYQMVVMETNPLLSSPLLNYLGQNIQNSHSFEDIGVANTVCISLCDVMGKRKKFREISGDFSERYKGVVYTLGRYAVGAAVSLLGSNLELLNTYKEISPKTGIDNSASVILRNNDTSAVINMSFLSCLPNILDIGGESGYYSIRDFAFSQGYKTCMIDGSPMYDHDFRDNIAKDIGISKKMLKSDIDYSLAMEIIKFEKAVAAGYKICYDRNLNHFIETKAVLRILLEIMAD